MKKNDFLKDLAADHATNNTASVPGNTETGAAGNFSARPATDTAHSTTNNASSDAVVCSSKIINSTISPTARISDFVHIQNSVIEDGAEILPFSFIKNSRIGCGSTVISSHIFDSTAGKNCRIGPNAHIRASSTLDDNVRVGNFVEIKNSHMGCGTKAAHLSYIGDAEIGKNCNIGCGTVFCNYDGIKKHPTQIGDNVFIGSNSNLIAPLTIGSNSFIAAGSTITTDIPDNSFAISRTRTQDIRPNKKAPPK